MIKGHPISLGLRVPRSELRACIHCIDHENILLGARML